MDDAAFDGDREAVIVSLPQKGVDRILWCGTDLESSLEAASYAGRFGYIYFACGFFRIIQIKWMRRHCGVLKSLQKRRNALQ